jgi:ketosteroid isomerase-like protein
MTYLVSRLTVHTFLQAYVSRDPERIGELIDDDVEWYVAGPVDVMQVCGIWRGKNAVIDRFKRIVPAIIEFKCLAVDNLLVDGDQSALFGTISCIQRESGRLISHRVAHLVRYRDDKVVYFRCINDSLDAAEQFVGHRIQLKEDTLAGFGEFVAV